MNSQSQKQVKIFSVIATVLAILMIVSIILILHSMFPKAQPVAFPEDFERLTVVPCGSDEAQLIPREEAALLLDALRGARPTRRMSVNDFPACRDYAAFTGYTPGSSPGYFRFYLYEDGGDMILEIPYCGIYIVRDPEHRIFGREMPVTDPEKE